MRRIFLLFASADPGINVSVAVPLASCVCVCVCVFVCVCVCRWILCQADQPSMFYQVYNNILLHKVYNYTIPYYRC